MATNCRQETSRRTTDKSYTKIKLLNLSRYYSRIKQPLTESKLQAAKGQRYGSRGNQEMMTKQKTGLAVCYCQVVGPKGVGEMYTKHGKKLRLAKSRLNSRKIEMIQPQYGKNQHQYPYSTPGVQVTDDCRQAETCSLPNYKHGQ